MNEHDLSPGLASTGLAITWRREGDVLTADILAGPQHAGPPGTFHGGLAALCLDEAAAALSRVLEGNPSITARLECVFRRPLPLDGRSFRVEARLVRGSAATSRWTVAVQLLDAGGIVAVTAEALVVVQR